MKSTQASSSPPTSIAGKSYLLRTQGFLRTQLWIWPLMAAAMLAFVGLSLRGRMEEAMKRQVGGTLETILNANAEALNAWSSYIKLEADDLADDQPVCESIQRLLPLATGSSAQTALLTAPEQKTLRNYLAPMLDDYGFTGFVVLNTNLVVLAAMQDQLVGLSSPANYAQQLAPALAGKTLVTQPFLSLILLPDDEGTLRSGVPTMFAVAPVKSADGRVMALLAMRLSPEKDFTRILATARSGKTGETYAFGRDGKLLSESRFDDNLKRLGLIPDTTGSRSILALELRDPLVNLDKGRKSPNRRAELPFTYAVAQGIAGKSSEDVEGYRDYRGVEVVGSWKWLPEFDIGLVTEMDVSEALQPLHVVRVSFWFIFGLLTLGSGLVFALMRLSNRLQSAARKAALKARQLGQYALDDKIGSGAFGSVYRAHHALMRRPVAVKLLEMEVKNDNTIARFEREVQLTSQLTHPNTIALYDYGRTPEGIFYYAMEYLDGLTLDGLVKQYGPQAEGRVIFILRQACGSLAEAHEIGLVHRDIKPANIFLTRRGGVPDFVKVLDFGLVKSLESREQVELTASSSTMGTPLYMSPEAVEHPNTVDARSDLYSLGAVGYFLLTGEHLFGAFSIGEVLMQQVKQLPPRPSERLNKTVSADLEDLLMRCLAKDPMARPANARALEEALSRCQSAGTWTRDLAEDWWQKYAAARADKTAPMKIEVRSASSEI